MILESENFPTHFLDRIFHIDFVFENRKIDDKISREYFENLKKEHPNKLQRETNNYSWHV